MCLHKGGARFDKFRLEGAVFGGEGGLSAYGQWIRLYFTPAAQEDPAISGPAATPLSDGVPNRLKFAMGHSPWDRVAPLRQSGHNDDGLPVFRFRQSTTPGADAIRTFSSLDLTAWSEDAQMEKSTVEQHDGYDVIEVQPAPAEFLDTWFLRLQVP